MDIFSHGLWAAAGAAAAKRKTKKPFRVGLAAFFGVFPDLFAFISLFFWIFNKLVAGEITFFDLPDPSEVEPSAPDTIWILRLTSLLYSISHSALIFFAVFAALALIMRRPTWEMLGWLFHIVIDVFTHSYDFYPTPLIWPISLWHFNGLPWNTPWFLLINYAALAGTYLLMLVSYLRKKGRYRKIVARYLRFKEQNESVNKDAELSLEEAGGEA